MIEMMAKAIELVKSKGASVSFDPNIRKEVVATPQVPRLSRPPWPRDTFLPSGEELTLLTEATTSQAAISEILSLGSRPSW